MTYSLSSKIYLYYSFFSIQARRPSNPLKGRKPHTQRGVSPEKEHEVPCRTTAKQQETKERNKKAKQQSKKKIKIKKKRKELSYERKIIKVEKYPYLNNLFHNFFIIVIPSGACMTSQSPMFDV